MEHKTIRIKGDFIEPVITVDNYVYDSLGSSVPKIVLVPNRDWKSYNTGFEDQKKNAVETMGCTGFNTHDSIQRIGKLRYGTDDNYSDRYLNIGAGTTRSGNSPHKVAEAIRQYLGCIPEEKLPFDETITSWAKYYSPKPLPQELMNIGTKWRNEHEFLHEWVFLPNQSLREKQDRIWEALKYSPVSTSVYGWRWNGQFYYKNTSDTDNHWTVIVNGVYGKYWEVDDTYEPYIKKLKWDYDFSYGKKYHYKKLLEESEKKNMDYTTLDKIYQKILCREPDEGASSYLNYDEPFVEEQLLKSKERQSIESLIGFFRKFGFLKGK